MIVSTTEVLKPNQEIDRRLSTKSFGSDNQVTQKKTSIPVNAVYNTKMYSLTEKDQHGTSLTLMQQLETRNFVPI